MRIDKAKTNAIPEATIIEKLLESEENQNGLSIGNIKISKVGDSKISRASTKRQSVSQLSHLVTDPLFGNEIKTANKKKPSKKRPQVLYHRLFRFATYTELFIIALGIVFGILTGVCLPLGNVIYGEFTTLLVDRSVRVGTSTPTVMLSWFGGGTILINASAEENRLALLNDSAAFGIGCTLLSIVQFIFGVLCVDLINFAAQRQISRIRKMFFESVLKQDMTWYDTNTNTNFASRITEDLEKYKEGIAEKLGIFIYLLSSFIASIAISFIYGWKLTLVVLSCAPVIIIATAVVAKVQSSLTEKELAAYGLAGSVAEEVLSSIRTVIAFGGEEKEINRYTERLGPAKATGSRKGIYSGVGGGIMWFIIYCSYALSFWYGVHLIFEDKNKEIKEYTPAVLIIVFFGVLAGAQNMGLASPHIEAFAVARGAASTIFKVLDRKPAIDSLSTHGIQPPKIDGDIEFVNAHFHYPARPEVKVLQGLNLKINKGETVALVGSSGCGKSTTIQLIQRLYDPIKGKVYLDGNDVSHLNVGWLRSHIGVVGQEPVLFATTIGENIRYGNPSATHEQIEKAAKEANCHEFIKKLPNGYDTMVGERGSQLSGGQKQRIAIARALVRRPAILLLDEATSALDLHSEAKVQKALDHASRGRTTIVVTHRLSTIKNANRIIYLHQGQVVEQGTEDELMALKSHFYNLVMADTPDTEMKPRKRSVSIRKRLIAAKSIQSTGGSSSASTELSDEEEEKEEVYPVSMWRIFKMNAPEWPFNLIGCIFAVVVGASFPAFAVIFGEVYGVLGIDDEEEVFSKSVTFAILFLVVGVITGVGTFIQTYMFTVAGVRLTTRLRIITFSSMLKQEMGWYDETQNSIGSLCARLASDAASVQGATGLRIGSVLQALSTLVLGIFISMFFTWKMTLVSLVCVPVVLGGVYIESKVSDIHALAEKMAIERASKIAIEGISNIRTVHSLGQERGFLSRYMEELENVGVFIRKKSRFRGCVFSLGQAAPFFGYALSLYYGGILVADEGLEYKSVIKVSEALIFGAWMMGQALAFAPNFNAAIVSAGRIFRLLDRIPKIHSAPVVPEMYNWKADGNINYKNIDFHYPTRPEVEILQQLELNITSGQTVALVGRSGCGKSTCIQLIQRLYDPDSGSVIMDNKDIKRDLSLSQLRAQLGIVSQEPVLFDRTIAENIAYGDNCRNVGIDEIMSAAKMSNIHTFISSLPLGYNTRLGLKGAQLSGGQKQRIAIARALVRNPRVLLLDEATSALDTQSEKVVQAALDKASKGRTCIIIAHRLATIRNADVICVLNNGKVAEMGSHEQLLAKGGLYTQLQALQVDH